MVSMIESALHRCSADWKLQNAELNTKMDLMLNLQEQRLQLDRERLEFEREMAGLPKSKPKTTQSTHLTKVAASRKRKKGNSHFCINVMTQHLTLIVSATHSSPSSQFSFCRESVDIAIQAAYNLIKILFLNIIFDYAPVVQYTSANYAHYFLLQRLNL